MSDADWEFTAEDFCHPIDKIDKEFWEQQKIHFQHMADIANARLRAERVKCPVVYGQILDLNFGSNARKEIILTGSKLEGHTYQARLDGIREIDGPKPE